MSDSENSLKFIANFLYRHRSEESWWTAPILIDKKGLRSLNLSVHEVEKILKALEQRGLLRPDGLTGVVRYTLYAFRIYRLDFARLEELAKFSGIPLWYRWYSKLWADREDGLKTFLTVCLTLLATAFLSGFLGEFGKGFYDWLSKLFRGILF